MIISKIMKRLHRLTALLVKLQSSKTLNIKKVAKEYEITERTVYRDIKALEDAGVPIGYEPSEGYFLLEGYQLPPIHFSSEEANAVITAQALVNENNDDSLVRAFAKVVEKVIAVLKVNDKNNSLLLKERIAPSTKSELKSSNSLMLAQRAIFEFSVLDLSYKDASGQMTRREIEPLGIYFTQNHWVIVAFCKLRKATREFRTDRIVAIKLTDKTFPPNQFALNDYFKQQEYS